MRGEVSTSMVIKIAIMGFLIIALFIILFSLRDTGFSALDYLERVLG